MADSPVPPYPQTPVLEMGPAVAVMVTNAIPGIAGVGTLIAGIVGQQRLIGRAVAQFLLQIIIVGWVWSIITGIQALTNAVWGSKQGAAAAAAPAPGPAPAKAKAASKSPAVSKAPSKTASKKGKAKA